MSSDELQALKEENTHLRSELSTADRKARFLEKRLDAAVAWAEAEKELRKASVEAERDRIIVILRKAPQNMFAYEVAEQLEEK